MSAVPNTIQAPRKSTRVTSEAVRQHSEKRSLTKPLVVTGIGPGKALSVTTEMYGQLDVDPAYQRGETSMIGEIVRALQAGGLSLAPITLCWRVDDPRKWYIVDGWQRANAHMQLKLPIEAILHKSDGVAAEATLFAVLNNRRAVQANVIVKGWAGPSGVMMRDANDDVAHPLYQRLNFTQGSNEARIASSTLVRALLPIIGVNKSPGRIHALLSRLDNGIESTARNEARVIAFLELLGRVYTRGTPPALVMRALATVARERWTDNTNLPSEKTIAKLRNRAWKTVLLEQYLSVLIEEVRRVWKA